ncbi:hypothetical protein EYF80_021515 [Liparis tanakae]|uniref:Uncharacterized protein n=1 Tax=Liparis tanakae TaxID=230148 RepID=A0A4Z2HTA4_9TELE|nr:hypothetical protein EYF80_021515 [Liparis tanakae]
MGSGRALTGGLMRPCVMTPARQYGRGLQKPRVGLARASHCRPKPDQGLSLVGSDLWPSY